jgi:hypothetical protein
LRACPILCPHFSQKPRRGVAKFRCRILAFEDRSVSGVNRKG